MKRKILSFAIGCACTANVIAQSELDSIEVLSKEELGFIQETNPRALSENQQAKELTDLVEQEAFVNTSSFSAAVGRPTIKGLHGSQVNIIHNDSSVSDVSALSDDHAIALVPLTTKRIEVLSGTRSMLYGSGSSGIRLIDRMDLEEDSELGNSGEVRLSGKSNNGEVHVGAIANAVGEKLELLVAGDHRNAQSYKAGKNKKVGNSQMKSTQGQVALRYNPDEDNRVQVYYTDLERKYGIPDPDDPDIELLNMRHKKYGAQWLSYAPTDKIDLMKLDISYQDYFHDEVDDGMPDALFGVESWQTRLELDIPVADWMSTWVLNAATRDLKLCRDADGGCYGFRKEAQGGTKGADRIPGLNGLHDLNIFAQTPDSKEHKLNLASYWEKDVDWFAANGAVSWAANIEYRQLETDPINLKPGWQDPRPDFYSDQKDWAFSLGTGLILSWNENSQWQFDLSYKERIPSVEELYWNGIDDGADSYYQGDYRLGKERSANLEIANILQLTDKQSLKTRGFYSYFTDYIFQEGAGELDDRLEEATPWITDEEYEGTPIYKTVQKDAYFWGLAATHNWQFAELFGQPLELTNQLEYVQAKLTSGGFVPRMAPASWTAALDYQYRDWQAQINLKTNARANKTANGEEETSGDSQLGLYAAWQPKGSYGDWKLWLKGDNLLDAESYDHTSFMKIQSPRMGRNFEAGVSLTF